MNHLIIGTAGHIDHGKTTLIKALTHIDTDRLKEEKKRGISIDLGFAYIKLPGGRLAGIVDVPGHEKFIKNMLAGATGMDMVLLVVATDEGVMPQTVEHLQILSLLDVNYGLVALTKIDTVDEETVELARLEVQDTLKGTFLEGCPVLPVSSVTGEGLDLLLKEIDRIAAKVPLRDLEAPPVMPVDRVFTIQGFGTVVTGTLAMGCLKCDDKIDIMPWGLSSRVRGLQVHGTSTQKACAGQRVAVNLAGIKKEQVNRGDLISAPGFTVPSSTLDVHLQVLDTAPGHVKSGQRLRIYIGAKEIFGRPAVIGERSVEPGRSGFARLRLEEPACALAGEPFVVRTYSPMFTIGGGKILDACPTRRKLSSPEYVNYLETLKSGTPEEILELIVGENGKGLQTGEELRRGFGRRKGYKDALVRCLNKGTITEFAAGGVKYYINSSYLNTLKDLIMEVLRQFHRENPLRQGIGPDELRNAVKMDVVLYEHILESLMRDRKVKRDQQYISLYDFTVTFSEQQKHVLGKIYTMLKDSGFVPVSLSELEQLSGLSNADLKVLMGAVLQTGEIMKVHDGVYLHHDNYNLIKEKLVEYIKKNGNITVAEFRDLLGVSRKYALMILEHFDDIKFTKRVGDSRVIRNP